MNRDEASKAIKHAVIAACVSVGLYVFGLLAAIALSNHGDSLLAALLSNPFSIFTDIILVLLLAYGLNRKSRFCGVLLILLTVFTYLVSSIDRAGSGSLIKTIVFCYFYLRGIQGAFAYHRLEAEENPGYKKSSWAAKISSVAFLLIFSLLMSAGWLSMSGYLAPDFILSGSYIQAGYLNHLKKSAVIMPDDRVSYLYLPERSLYRGGVIMLEDRVVVYQPDNDGYTKSSLRFSEVTMLERKIEGDDSVDSVYLLSGSETGSVLRFSLSRVDGMDVKFLNELKKRVNDSN